MGTCLYLVLDHRIKTIGKLKIRSDKYGLMTNYFQDGTTQNQTNNPQNGETPAKVEIKIAKAENVAEEKDVSKMNRDPPKTENGKETQVNFNFALLNIRSI